MSRPTTARVIIDLDLTGDPAEALRAVHKALDAGALQEEIETFADSDVRVTSTLARLCRRQHHARLAAHCTGGCGDIDVTRADLEAARCPHCGRELDTVHQRMG